MGKIRVHELAKKLNFTNQDLIAKLNKKGILVRSHSSSIDEMKSLIVLGYKKNTNFNITPKTVLRRRKKDSKETNINIKQNKNDKKVYKADNKTSIDHNTLKQTSLTIKQNKNKLSTLNANNHIALRTFKEDKNIKNDNITKTIKHNIEHKLKDNNVVRIIDAKSIKARLAQDGRNFKSKSFKNDTYKSNVIKKNKTIKEFVYKTNTFSLLTNIKKSGHKTNWKSSKRKTRNEFEKINKESSSGGYELWLAPGKKKRTTKKNIIHSSTSKLLTGKRTLEINEAITVNELSHKMSIKAGKVISKLMNLGMMLTANQPINAETASTIASEFNYKVKNIAFKEKKLLHNDQNKPEQMFPRAPIVTIMGHVDHGKTTIIDSIRKSNIANKEFGKITQHIGAYSVDTRYGKIIFLDTPGHEAFISMRARGSKITDIIILVVAADDGVMPQTIEAINHAKQANVPIIVALNKIDSINSNPDKVLKQLSENNILTEEWGGDIQIFKVSAIKKQGLNDLIEGIAILAEMLELKSNPNRMAEGFVIESKLDKGRGPMATIIAQDGTIHKGDYLIAGKYSCKIRAMYDSNGKSLKKANTSIPVQVLGFNGIPSAGDKFNVVKNEKIVKKITEYRRQKIRETELMKTAKISCDNFLHSAKKSHKYGLKLIIKADVFGSVEALSASLISLSTTLIKIEIINSGVGAITESDVNLAIASNAIIIGFNIKPDFNAQALATKEKVNIKIYKLIYEIVNSIKNIMAGLLDPVIKEKYLGMAEVRMVIPVGKCYIAGSYVVDGKIIRSGKIKVKRDDKIIHTCNIASLKHFKENTKEILHGYECGIGLENFINIKIGDKLECFLLEKIESLDYSKKLSTKKLEAGSINIKQ